MTKITLYHGTTESNARSIISDGCINGRVYLTPNKATAEDYAANNSSNYVVFEVVVDYCDLQYDDEFINGETDDWVSESLNAGSVYVDHAISVKDFPMSKYVDYEMIGEA